MPRASSIIDITHTPELLRLAEEVAKTGRPRVLRRDSEDIAVISPVPPRHRARKVKTTANWEALRSAAGSWKGLIDGERFLEDVYESRRSSRPPVEL